MICIFNLVAIWRDGKRHGSTVAAILQFGPNSGLGEVSNNSPPDIW
jgi:hypothetical protein